MDTRRDIPLGEALAGAQDWWREAGVDCDFADEPHNWLEVPEAPSETPAPAMAAVVAAPVKPKQPPLGGERDTWPKTLVDFAHWWRAEPSLSAAGNGPRLAPRGFADAKLMILVAMPEAGDTDTLLSGPHGQLLTAMHEAMGLDESEIYLATALPCHASHADWTGLAARGFGDIVRHHIALAAPQRILLLGRDILTLFQHDPAQRSVNPRQIALDAVDPAVLAAVGPETLLQGHRFRAALWRAWLDWRE
ncbi:hypothetical protein GRI89_08130 [Altererythrobacter salegens]|uniref:Uracil-DNA glycosylase-like domain-containing protein n=1 Tax=Croceibacterium salegens TaxID=1737568 RepID=A0A6I4SWT6_9SPHN|nr:uracil-DNA glycosylase family protein [Croceibacterium salegens]MXO59507.1 hypothetical protein [Croceibacterium salegens]